MEIHNDKSYRISFCTTCKGRLHHLKETLPQNIAHNANYPNTEFVILDYGDEDGLGDWLKLNYQGEIDSGKIRYARYESDYFRMAHAKNMAHRLATGDILCNLDADNVTAKDYANWLNKQFSQNPDIYIRPHRKNVVKKEIFNLKGQRGLLGCIAIHRNNFFKLHGYDEKFNGWGGDDENFDFRAKKAGLVRTDVPNSMLADAIQHTDVQRVALLEPHFRSHSESLLHSRHGLTGCLARVARLNGRKVRDVGEANPDGSFGCGRVHINFLLDEELVPLIAENRSEPEVGEPVSWQHRQQPSSLGTSIV